MEIGKSKMGNRKRCAFRLVRRRRPRAAAPGRPQKQRSPAGTRRAGIGKGWSRKLRHGETSILELARRGVKLRWKAEWLEQSQGGSSRRPTSGLQGTGAVIRSKTEKGWNRSRAKRVPFNANGRSKEEGCTATDAERRYARGPSIARGVENVFWEWR